MDAVACGNGGDKDHGAAELDVDPPRATDDLTAENIFKPGGSRFGVGTAQMNVVPGDLRHFWSPMNEFARSVMPAGNGRRRSIDGCEF
jgi:hypothetical protein